MCIIWKNPFDYNMMAWSDPGEITWAWYMMASLSTASALKSGFHGQ
jgi:hypothetical protein